MTRDVALTKPEKILFPAAGDHDAITKADVFDYATRIADRMLRFLRNRPAVLQRFPDGIEGDGWYQKHTPKHFPDWIPRTSVPKAKGGSVSHVVIDSVEALQYVVNQGTVSIHVLGGRADRIDVPADLLIDLDPSIDDPAQVVESALVVRELLDDLELVGFVNTTGSRGVHIHLPLLGDARFDAIGALGSAMAKELVRRAPDLLTTAFSKDDRGDRLFVDTLRNAPAQHAIAPYTLRPKSGAPVAVPIRWDSLDSSWRPDATPLRSLFRRLGSLSEDPWEHFEANRIEARTIAGRLQQLH